MKNQNSKDTAIRDLYETMMTMLKAASEEDILVQRDKLRGHFEKMTKLSIQCSFFIAGYSSGSYYSMLMYDNILTIHRAADIISGNRTADKI
jgi:hypothetical protein